MGVVIRLFLEVQPIDEIRRVFELIDVDKTGAITAPQLKEAIESLGDHIDISEAEAMINEAAHTHTDQSECTQFQKICNRTILIDTLQ
jgi:Ca2+-binding EF-hand superfamily protein